MTEFQLRLRLQNKNLNSIARNGPVSPITTPNYSIIFLAANMQI